MKLKLDVGTFDKLDNAVDALLTFKELLDEYDGGNLALLAAPHFERLEEARDEITAAWNAENKTETIEK